MIIVVVLLGYEYFDYRDHPFIITLLDPTVSPQQSVGG